MTGQYNCYQASDNIAQNVIARCVFVSCLLLVSPAAFSIQKICNCIENLLSTEREQDTKNKWVQNYNTKSNIFDYSGKCFSLQWNKYIEFCYSCSYFSALFTQWNILIQTPKFREQKNLFVCITHKHFEPTEYNSRADCTLNGKCSSMMPWQPPLSHARTHFHPSRIIWVSEGKGKHTQLLQLLLLLLLLLQPLHIHQAIPIQYIRINMLSPGIFSTICHITSVKPIQRKHKHTPRSCECM